MNSLTLNDALQWGSIIVILAIAVFTIVRKTVRFRRKLKSGENAGCGCGTCDGCPKLSLKNRGTECNGNGKNGNPEA